MSIPNISSAILHNCVTTLSTKGIFHLREVNFSGAYSLYTDNFARYNGHAPFSALSASWESVFSISNRLTLIPALYGRVLIGQEIPYAYENALGGDVFGRYLPQQLPFAGIYNIELTHNSVAVASLNYSNAWVANIISRWPEISP